MSRPCSIFVAAAVSLAATVLPAAPPGLYELRIYEAPEGKLDALHARFREHTTGLFAKHGMTNVGYFVPLGDNPARRLVYVLGYPDRAARDASWQAFLADSDWKAAHAASERDGRLVVRIESHVLVPTDYSPWK
jgi:hypothetical protein